MFVFSPMSSQPAKIAIITAAPSAEFQLGIGTVNSPQFSSVTSLKTTCTENHNARLAITPTTAAETPDSIAASHRTCLRRSTKGAPAKIHKKHGTKVNQSAIKPPATPPHNAG